MRGKRQKERQEQEEAKKRVEIERRQRERAIRKTITEISETLKETDDQALGQIERIVEYLGVEQALAYLQQTQQIEAQGGMMLTDGSRRRTPGGVFFYLVKQQLKAEERKEEIKRIFSKAGTAKPAPDTADVQPVVMVQ